MKRYSRQTSRRRRLILLTLLTPVGAYAVSAALASRPASEGAAAPSLDQPNGVRAYLVATGIFARPAPDEQPSDFAAAETVAAAAGVRLAYSIWTDRDSFDTRAWRDLIQVGRVPVYRPPAIDFMREVAVLVWPVSEHAPAAVLHASGLVLSGATLQHTAVEVRVAPTTGGPAPATPAPGGPVLPYALITIPRNQWPVPAPPPTVPPLTVALVS
ncbi:MAG: hypothetical protein ACRDJN_01000 [Chloroflexota bacterium]